MCRFASSASQSAAVIARRARRQAPNFGPTTGSSNVAKAITRNVAQIGRVRKTEKSPSDMIGGRQRPVSTIGPRMMPMTIGASPKPSYRATALWPMARAMVVIALKP